MKIQERTGAGNTRSAAPVQPAVGERLPTPPRERKPALAALAVLLILAGALGATVLVLQVGNRVEVVKLTADVPAGKSVDDSDMTSVLVARDESINYVEWTQKDGLKKLRAKSALYKGTVVVGEMFTGKKGLPAGKASVGLSLKEGQYPDGIKSGDTVAAYRVGSNSAGSNSSSSGTSSSGSAAGTSNSLIVGKASVNEVKEEGGDATISSGNKVLTLLVDQSDAPALAQAASAGEVALVLVPGN